MVTPRILIRHLAGSKANRIEQFQLDGAQELILGRGPAANVTFDTKLDDTVSRRHAIIKITRSDRLSFTIADLGSSNGVVVNGRPVRAEQILLPDDIVELSPGGPAFRIAVEPETLCPADAALPPQASILRRTGLTEELDENSAAVPPGSEKPRSGPHYWRVVASTVVVATALDVGAPSYQRVMNRWRAWMLPESQTQAPASTGGPASSPPVPVAAPRAASRSVVAPADAATPASAAPAAAAIVYLQARWRLYDKFTGKPVFQKTVTRKDARLPCFVALADGRIVPWLTTDDEEHTNRPIGGVIGGTGFIISGWGSIITSRRIAAGWTVRYREAEDGDPMGLLFHSTNDPTRDLSGTLIDLTAPDGTTRLIDWIPGEGTLFRSRYPAQVGSSGNELEGRNDILDVQLPFYHVGTQAHVVRAFLNAGLAELKIDVDRPLPVISMSDSPDPRVGERITALGYAGSLDTPLDHVATSDMTGGAGFERRRATPQAVTIAEGTITGVERVPGGAAADAGGGIASGWSGDIYRLSMNDARLPDAGPVLDDSGRTVGVLVSHAIGPIRQVYAYPIRLVRALLQSQ